MKKLNYLQFYYGGEYTKESIEIPDDALVFKINNNKVSYCYKEKDIWSYNIVILSKESTMEELEGICLGEWNIAIIDSVYSEYNFNGISEFPKIEFYIVENNFSKVDLSLPLEEIEKESIYRISKFKGIDDNNTYFSYVTIKNPITMKDTYLLNYGGYDICNTLFGCRTKIAYGEKYKKLYEEFCNKVISKIL